MAKRSLKANPTGIARAKQAFQRTGWTQEYLASEVGLETRQSIWKFFSGRPVERHIFIDICFCLDLNWEDIAEPPEVEPLEVHVDRVSHQIQKNKANEPALFKTASEVDQWIEQIRKTRFLQVSRQCDGLHSPLLLSQPLQVSQTYVEMEFTTELAHQRWLDIEALEELFWQNTADALSSLTPTARLPLNAVIEHTSRLVVIGSIGTGKTTLLKHLALQCNAGHFQPHCIPLLITLRNLSENQKTTTFTLKNYIIKQLTQADITYEQAEIVLQAGRVQLFLDGLDEVAFPQRIAQEICTLCQQFPNLPIIISHRATGIEAQFSGFRYVEIADFSDTQIKKFARQWFDRYGQSEKNYQQFIAQLEDPKQLSLKQLARCPLILLGLCIISQRAGSTLTDESRLYRTLSNLLISRWNQIKGLEHILTVSNVELPPLLGWLASQMLEQDQIFVERSKLLDSITEYLIQETSLSLSFLDCHQTSSEILRTILRQTGILVEKSQDIYAFTHLRLQKSLAAQHLGLKAKHGRQKASAFKGLVLPLGRVDGIPSTGSSSGQSLVDKIRQRLTHSVTSTVNTQI